MIDNSGSMAVDGKMEAANNAISAAATAVKDLQSANQETDSHFSCLPNTVRSKMKSQLQT